MGRQVGLEDLQRCLGSAVNEAVCFKTWGLPCGREIPETAEASPLAQ